MFSILKLLFSDFFSFLLKTKKKLTIVKIGIKSLGLVQWLILKLKVSFIMNVVFSGPSLFFPHDDDVDYPTDMKGELTQTMPYHNMVDDNGDIKLCVVCGERASGFYFGALVCLPCKVSKKTVLSSYPQTQVPSISPTDSVFST